MQPESTPTWLIGPQIPPTQRIGTVLSGSYRLDAFLGQGMTGITYNAWHLRQKLPYAVKLLHRELQPSHERVLRLRQDLRTLSGLRRFGFLPVEVSFAPDGAPFLASELLTGETLRNRLSRGPLPVLATGIVTAALARALGEAHQQNIVHGDLRPENVLLPSEAGREIEAGQPVLLDAALHHLRRRPIGLDESLPLGKLVYLAPEQASGEQQTANVGGDIFALGAILYECLTGQQAFAAAELEVVLEKLAAPPQKLALPREVGAPPGLAEALDAVVQRACARDPEERYPTMAELLVALDQAFTKSGLPLPPPDERVSIDTVRAQNRELRKRTLVVKKVVPLGPLTELPESSGVMSAATFAQLNSFMSAASPESSVSPPPGADSGAKPEAGEATGEKSASARRITAKQRVVRRTVRARDLSRLLTAVESGRLDASQAMALAEKDEGDADAEGAVPESVDDTLSAAQRIIADGRAAVIARAETAKKNRDVDTKERQQRDHAAAQEMQRRLLEQARQETLGRMRAEWEQSRPISKIAAKDLAAEPAAPPAGEGKPAPVQSELQIEAQRHAQRLEAERTDAERHAAEEAENARTSAAAAQASRKDAARLEAELRAAEHREAERAEAVRRQSEREQEARRLAEEAEQARAAKQAEAETRRRAAEDARASAEIKLREAEAARLAADSDAEMALWEDGLDLVIEDKPDHTIPPPPPAAAMRARSEAAKRATAEAKQAEAAAATEAAELARRAAAEIEQRAEAARREQEEAAAARAHEAAELANAVEAAEGVRAQDQALNQQIRTAELRAQEAEAARIATAARVSRVTQALHVLRQVQTMVNDEPPPPSEPVSAPSSNSADTGRFHRPDAPPAQSEQIESVSAVPSGPLASEVTGRRATPAPSAAAPAVEPAEAMASLQTGPQVATAGSRTPEAAAPNVSFANAQSGRVAASSAPQAVRPELSAGYSAAQLVAAGMRPDLSAGYSAAQLAAAGIRPDLSTGYSAAQLAAAGIHPGTMQQPMHPGMSHPRGLPQPLAPMQSGPTGRAEGDVSAMMSASQLRVIPALLPTGVLPMVPGQLLAAPPSPQESSGVTLTTRQLVATLTMTSVLSGVIGALIALLVLQNSQKPVDTTSFTPPPSVVTSGQEPTALNPVAAHPAHVEEVKGEPARTTTAPTTAPVVPVAPHPAAAGGPYSLMMQRGGIALPPLRMLQAAPIGLPRQSAWTRPGGPAATSARPPAPTAGAKPTPRTLSAPATKGPPAPAPKAESSPAAGETKAPATPSAKSSAETLKLHNPFAK